MLTAFINGTILTPEKMPAGKALIVSGEYFHSITDTDLVPQEAEIVDCSGKTITPGLIDLQIAGAGGYLFSSDLSEKALAAICDSIASSGTTGFLLAIPTNAPEIYSKAIRVIKDNPHPALIGLHLEGPYISLKKKGAHMSEYIVPPTGKDLEKLLAEAEGTIKMMTVAPEVCDREIIELLIDNGVTVAAGHSNATFSEAAEGFKRGIRTTTHLFNAMSPLHHRDPGLPGAAFMSEKAFASIIADNIHVDFNMVSLAKKIMPDRLFLVSDAVEENNRGAYLHVRKKERYTLPDGTLSGSALTMAEAVRNCVRYIGIPLEEACRMATSIPAEVIQNHERGLIGSGKRADFIIWDESLNLTHIFLGGKKITG